jgi:superfamily II DNA or RNA helicase
MIQRQRGSRWFDDGVLLPLPRMHYRRVAHQMPNETQNFIEKIALAKAKLGYEHTPTRPIAVTSGVGIKFTGIVKKCVSIPGLARLAQKSLRDPTGDIFEFNVEWMHKHACFTTNLENDCNPYHKYLEDLQSDAHKLRDIDNILNEQLRRTDFLGRPTKGIIFTRCNEVALVIYKYLTSKFSAQPSGVKVKPALVYGSMDKRARQEAANAFQDGDDINIIIGVSSALGTGLTLTRAQFTIIVEQESDPGMQVQTIGRMLRQTNWNWLGLNVFELICSNAKCEVSTQQTRLGREKFAKALEQQTLDKSVQQSQQPDEDERSDEDEPLDI